MDKPRFWKEKKPNKTQILQERFLHLHEVDFQQTHEAVLHKIETETHLLRLSHLT